MSEVRRIVLLPRLSSFAGPGTWNSAPLNIREFATAKIMVWTGEGVGTSPVFQFEIQESPDLEIWNTILTVTTTDEVEAVEDAEFSREWNRVVVTLSSSSVTCYTCWAVGDFVMREPRA